MKLIIFDQKTKEAFLQAVIAEAAAQLNVARGIPEIRINKKLTETVTKPKNNAIINFSPMAWLKMRTQIQNSKEECAWHGIVEANEDRTSFNIIDILVYPQRIQGVTVEDDDPKYEEWHQGLDTYTYNHIRMQGHSHIEMHASPSGRDTQTYDNVVQALSVDSFYIFMIANKQGNMWFNIYDLLNNRLWEQADIDVTINNVDLYGWFKEMSDTYYAKKTYGGSKTTEIKASGTTEKSATFLGTTIPTLEEVKAKNKKLSDIEYTEHNIRFSDKTIDAFYAAGDTFSERSYFTEHGGAYNQ